MDVTVTVGDVSVKLRGVDMTSRQIHALIRSTASIAVALGSGAEDEPERPPMGFAAHMERAPDVYEDLSEWFEQSP